MTETLNFQSMILALHHYWDEQGCLIWHPYYSQVGAGTMNPATFLRVLGPEPFNVGYVEPSVRPDDGRYGENPNRLQMFYQYQVILKPDPGNPQELYLKSLEAVGIDPSKHDIRFVEDNWESPALGAWGLGWEVWLDGLEITQFTYFQQAGQLELKPVSVEITYGLDRIAAPLQGVNNFKDIQWNQDRTFGDMNFKNEQEQSQYYFEVADVDRMLKIYNLHQEEIEAALEQNLVMPAYDNLLKLSHLFNVLDTRGAIGVTERQAYFRQMRGLARKVADLYVEQRQHLEFPWVDEGVEIDMGTKPKKQKAKAPKLSAPDKKADFLLEIGTEELPPDDLDVYLGQLAENIPTLLEKNHLEHGEVKVFGTPRRLVVHVADLAAEQPDRDEIHRGPPADRAFSADGEPTKAAEGFAKGKGVEVGALEVQEIDGGEYVVVQVSEKGRPAVEVLYEALADLIAGLKVDKTMRWNSSNVTFSRPIRWLAAMHGTHMIPFEYAELTGGMTTRGLRFSDAEEFSVKDAKDYFAQIEKQGIILDVMERKAAIQKQVAEIAKKVKGKVADDPALLAEVTHLVEAPTALIGNFDEEHLKLPREVLVSVMKKHQRYFPVYSGDDLLPYFVTVRNGGAQHLDIVAKGNEAVVRARFADADFFVSEDLKKPLKAYVDDLDTLTFQKDLGSMLEKTQRVTGLVKDVAGQLGLDEAELKAALRGAELCKADLVTSMVVEMTSLQGVIGQQYAEQSGEPADAALAIFEHYLPRSSGDIAPSAKPGLTVGLADRLDSLAGLFAAGLAPTGTKDPFALRRAALGLVQNLIAWDVDFDVRAGLETAVNSLPIEAGADTVEASLNFIVGRMQNLFLEDGLRHDIVSAVLAEQGHNPAGAKRGVDQLTEWVGREDWENILDSYARCVRITRKSDLDPIGEKFSAAMPDIFTSDDSNEKLFTVDEISLEEDEEKALYSALQKAEKVDRAVGSVDDLLNAFMPMMDAVTAFFDNVMVMVEDEKVKNNRLGMLQRIAALADGVADLSHLEGF